MSDTVAPPARCARWEGYALPSWGARQAHLVWIHSSESSLREHKCVGLASSSEEIRPSFARSLPIVQDQPCMHEYTLSKRPFTDDEAWRPGDATLGAEAGLR